MKVIDLILELSKLDSHLDILFTKDNCASDLFVDAELVNGYAVWYSKKDDPMGLQPPIFVNNRKVHSSCEGGKTFLNFKSKHIILPAVYLKCVEPNHQAMIANYQANEVKKAVQLELFI